MNVLVAVRDLSEVAIIMAMTSFEKSEIPILLKTLFMKTILPL